MYGWLRDTIIIIAIIAGIVGIIIALVRSKDNRPLIAGLLLFGWCTLACYSAITACIYYSTQSNIVGEPVEHDPYEDFNFFEYNVTDFALEQTEDGTFFFQKTYATSTEFDGTDKNYTLLINNKPCDSTSSNYGVLNGSSTIHFDDVDGSYKCGIKLEIKITFYMSYIVLRIDTNTTQSNADLLRQYVAINGLELRIIEQIYSDAPVLGDKPN